ncbi:hypothetical protein [Nocardioides sp. LS1]|uniref:hypothetical protein n=1 Tax=Nocardioides sp. LS1 TaxID=1027620 RepID=UPI000F616D59|nr:hypothetical protein [Nocardioides sp. LS1]GCD92260.1 hypothetical protein NLS1_42660 [Nocardioides sp. LS1]
MATYDESAEPHEHTEGAVPADIQAERERRLDPDNRPANAEVDNTGKTLPTVEEFKELNAGEDVEGAAGSSDPGAAFRRIQPSEEEIAEIEAERERRLDPANRPANAEVDYTGENMPEVARD